MNAIVANLSLGMLAYCFAAVFVAGLIRGYCGFGFSALVVASLTLVLPPVEVIPFVFMLEIAASIGMLPTVWRWVDRRLLGWLLGGYVIGAPIGLYALTHVDEAVVRIIISIIILVISIAMLRGFVFRAANYAVSIFGTGIVSGAVNGVSAVGGMPVVLLMLANSVSAAITRASIVAFLMLGNIYATAFTYGAGIVTQDVLIRFVIFLFPMAIGVFFGSRQFVKSSPDSFKALALWLLIGLATLGLLRLAL